MEENGGGCGVSVEGPWRASGALEASDSQFSSGHFPSFQPQALIVLLPKPPSQSILSGQK